ncbi:hypothetical protein [Desulfosarcina cetonica]|uniref:hypothetical protein n=1 Tax=Desulfosarcina cetonica TaxID=90730 RepID=UPI001FEF96AB|nr:hypothetical protein [Desulfosarcina cetonica]
MFKKVMKGAMIGAAALTLGAPAQAADITVNLFGASAQYEFWTSAAPAFLDSVCNGPVLHAKGSLTGVDGTRDTGIAMATDCQGVGDNVTFTYTTFSSEKGILAVSNQAGYDGCGTGRARSPMSTTAPLRLIRLPPARSMGWSVPTSRSALPTWPAKLLDRNLMASCWAPTAADSSIIMPTPSIPTDWTIAAPSMCPSPSSFIRAPW